MTDSKSHSHPAYRVSSEAVRQPSCHRTAKCSLFHNSSLPRRMLSRIMDWRPWFQWNIDPITVMSSSSSRCNISWGWKLAFLIFFLSPFFFIALDLWKDPRWHLHPLSMTEKSVCLAEEGPKRLDRVSRSEFRDVANEIPVTVHSAA